MKHTWARGSGFWEWASVHKVCTLVQVMCVLYFIRVIQQRTFPVSRAHLRVRGVFACQGGWLTRCLVVVVACLIACLAACMIAHLRPRRTHGDAQDVVVRGREGRVQHRLQRG